MTLNTQPSLQLDHTKPPEIVHQQSAMNLEKKCAEGYEAIPNALISAAIRWTLAEVNLDTVTKRQVRAIVEKRLELELGEEHLSFFNQELDRQLQEIELAS